VLLAARGSGLGEALIKMPGTSLRGKAQLVVFIFAARLKSRAPSKPQSSCSS